MVVLCCELGCRRTEKPKGVTVTADTSAESSVEISELTPQEAMLSETRQQEVWDAEHATHLIEHRFGVEFKEALASRSATRLSKLISDAAGVNLVDGQPTEVEQVSSVSSAATSVQSKRLASDQAGLVQWLLDLHAGCMSDSKYAFRVLSIKRADSLTDQWEAEILLTCQSSLGNEGRQRVESHHRVTFEWQDVDELGQSAAITQWEVESVRSSRTPRELMQEVTLEAGLSELPVQDNWSLIPGKKPQMIRFQMAVADYNRDGFLDIALSNAGNNLLLHFENGRFLPVTTAVGIHPLSRGEYVDISAGWLDFDNDGFPDLILGGRVYHNERGRKFVDVTDECGIEFRPHHMGCAVADYNLDGFLDVYFVYAHGADKDSKSGKAWIGDEQSGGFNQLWKNQGDGTFVDATDDAGVAGGKRQSFAANWLFADDDAFPDLYVANDFGTNSLFRNRGDGTFEDLSHASGTADFATSMGVATGDLDNDGTAEIYVANMYSKMGRRIVGQVKEQDYPAGIYPRLQGACAGSRLYHLDSKASSSDEFSERAGVNQVGWAYAPAMVDLNNDGLLDLYATCGFLSVDRKKPDG